MKTWIFLSLIAFSASSYAEISRSTKEHWLSVIKSCHSDCATQARVILNHYKEQESASSLILNENAKSSVLYLHSFTRDPSEFKDFHESLLHSGDINFFAPVFTAHHQGADPLEFKNIGPQDWLLDAELSLWLVSALGQKVTVHGFSMGGLAALDLAQRFPEKIDQLVLISPAVMIAGGGDDWSCLGQNTFVQSVTKWASSRDRIYLDKVLNGACPLSNLIKTVRDRQKDRQEDAWKSSASGETQSLYYDRIEQVKRIAKSIKARTLFIYTENDSDVDVKALKILSENLSNSENIVFRYQDGQIPHYQMRSDLTVPVTSESLYNLMKRFILNP